METSEPTACCLGFTCSNMYFTLRVSEYCSSWGLIDLNPQTMIPCRQTFPLPETLPYCQFPSKSEHIASERETYIPPAIIVSYKEATVPTPDIIDRLRLTCLIFKTA